MRGAPSLKARNGSRKAPVRKARHGIRGMMGGDWEMEGIAFYFDWEVALMEMLQSHLGPIGAQIAAFISEFGEEMVLVAVLGFLYWCYDKHFGIFIGTNILVGILINPMAKNIVLRRRPYFDNPGIKCLKPVDADADIYDIAAQGYSFPSGHSCNSAILYGSFPVIKKKRVFYIIAVVIPLLVGISRVLVGVHYPTDVMAGWLLGLFVVLFISYLQRHVKRRHLLHICLFAVALAGIFYCRTTDYFTSLGMMGGFFLGVAFEEKYVKFGMTRKPLKIALRLLGGFALYFGLNAVLKLPFPKDFLAQTTMASFLIRTVRYLIVTFLVIGVYPLVFDKIKFKKAAG